MTIKKTNFGEFNPDGSIKHDVDMSVISERLVQPGDALKRVSGTPYFFRLTAEESRRLTPEKRAEIEAAIRPVDADVKTVGKEGKTPEQKEK